MNIQPLPTGTESLFGVEALAFVTALHHEFDGRRRALLAQHALTWAAHPDLVPTAREVFEQALAGRANQKERLGDAFKPRAGDAAALLDELVLADTLAELLTPAAYARLA